MGKASVNDSATARASGRRDVDDLITSAKEHRPIRTYCLFSGGNDSMVVAHRCRQHYDELVFLDTGTAVPGVEDFVSEAAKWLGKPVRVMRHGFDAYRFLVLGGVDPKGRKWYPLGFPGPGQHGRTYSRLKERLLEQLLRETKVGHPRRARVLALSGIRRAESRRRRRREPITRKDSLVFCNPLIDWSNEEMRAYHRKHSLPQSDVAALLHRSGECNCSCFAAPGEREMLRGLWPQWWEKRFGSLEREARASGIRCATWGERCHPPKTRATPEAGELCSSCDWRQERSKG